MNTITEHYFYISHKKSPTLHLSRVVSMIGVYMVLLLEVFIGNSSVVNAGGVLLFFLSLLCNHQIWKERKVTRKQNITVPKAYCFFDKNTQVKVERKI